MALLPKKSTDTGKWPGRCYLQTSTLLSCLGDLFLQPFKALHHHCGFPPSAVLTYLLIFKACQGNGRSMSLSKSTRGCLQNHSSTQGKTWEGEQGSKEAVGGTAIWLDCFTTCQNTSPATQSLTADAVNLWVLDPKKTYLLTVRLIARYAAS